ncbi:MAG: bifunctional adenosylcobinamide kinase/adenosylcobinamide-phosphate guanylyltransferase [Bacillota bacterium]
MGELILVLGGARSGKSRYAERLAADYAKVIYLATGQVTDSEMAERIALHRASRPASWRTVEEGYQPASALRQALGEGPAEAVLLDCVSFLVTNHLLAAEEGFESRARQALLELLHLCRERELHLIAVSNEVGMALVPEHRLGRLFRDAQGRINQLLAREADRVYACIAGIAVDLKRIGDVIE